MNPTTFVQMVTEEVIKKLKENPDTINEIDRKGGYATCMHRSVKFFLTDHLPPDEEYPLATIFGTEEVECSALERGHFHLLAPADLATLAKSMAGVSLDDVKSRLDDADLEDLVDGKWIDDLDVLPDGESEEEIAWEIERLLTFYQDAAKKQVGLVIFSI